jgi:ATP-dependent exoDNAse (exonuclease V) beta subunit
MRNNQEKVAEQVKRVLGGIHNKRRFLGDINSQVSYDDGSVIVRSNNYNHLMICGLLANQNFPIPSDGGQEGSIFVHNEESDDLVEIN